MESEKLLIRNITNEDILRVAKLNEELGYPSNIESVTRILSKIGNNKNYKTYVAEIDSIVVGYIGMCLMYAYEYDAAYIRVLSLVVDKNYRNNGIGRRLLKSAERYAEDQNAIAIAVNSGMSRKEAHEFYKNNDYSVKGYGFSKKLV